MMQNQGQQNQQQFEYSNQVQPQYNHGGHELFDAHEAISGLVGGLEHCLLYDQHIQDPELKSIAQKQKTFLSQMYNTIVDTLKTGQNPAVKTQSYQMTEDNTTLFGMQPTQPKAPAQSVNELNDQCISSFMLGHLKESASAFCTTALETTNPVMRRVFQDSIPNLIEMAYEIYQYQNKHHYYQVPQLQQNDMQNYINSFAPMSGNISGGTMH